MTIIKNSQSVNGADYFWRGWQLIRLPGIRRFVIVPLVLNALLMGGAFIWLYYRLDLWITSLMAFIPAWLQWLNYLLWPLSVISVLLVFSYLFSTLANLIAAPFCGLLSEQLEVRLTGTAATDSPWLAVIKDTPRTLARECHKLAWYFPRALGLIILYFIPGLGQTIAPLLWFLFSAWMQAIQYCDYPFDNSKKDFQQMKSALWQHKTDTMQFGTLVSLATMIPLVNLVIMPVAVCGATAMWIDRYRPQTVYLHRP